jgi:hypothetical protein
MYISFVKIQLVYDEFLLLYWVIDIAKTFGGRNERKNEGLLQKTL